MKGEKGAGDESKLIGEILDLQGLRGSWDRIPPSPRVAAQAYQALRRWRRWGVCFGCWIQLRLERAEWLMSWYVFKSQ